MSNGRRIFRKMDSEDKAQLSAAEVVEQKLGPQKKSVKDLGDRELMELIFVQNNRIRHQVEAIGTSVLEMARVLHVLVSNVEEIAKEEETVLHLPGKA